MPTGVSLQLFDVSTPRASLTGIQACWWDVTEPKDFNSPIGKSNLVTTDASGFISLDLSNVTGLASGEDGFLLVYKLDGADHRESLIFAGKVTTSTVGSGVDMYYYDSGWTRPASWLSMPDPGSGEEKFVGLHAVYEDSNFVALSATGAYTINWGDGSGDINTASGVTAERSIAYADAPNTSDVGIAEARACTFQDSGDTATLTAHGFLNGAKVSFSVINSTTGISTYTRYYVVGQTANTFQVAATIGGTALALTTNGTGSVYTPVHRQVIVTLTMQAAGTFTSLNLHVKHSQSLLQVYSSGFLDIGLSGSLLTDLRLAVQLPSNTTQVISFSLLKRLSIVNSDLRQLQNLFYICRNLREIGAFVTSAAASVSAACTFQDSGDTVTLTAHGFRNGDTAIFSAVVTTTGITAYTQYFVVGATANTFQVSASYGGSALALTTDGTGTSVRGTNFSFMFSSCPSLQTVPLFNTAAGTAFSFMFSSCSSLQTVPLFNTAAGTIFSFMFRNCPSLQTVPLFNTAAGTTFSSMFSSCPSLKSGALSGTTRGVSYSGCQLSAASLNEIYTNLGTAAGAQTITVTNNWGTATDDPSIATAKGWTVTG